MTPKDYYAVLQVSRGESPAGIAAAYQKLARMLAPDAEALREPAEAYDVLSSPLRRRRYDEALDLNEQESGVPPGALRRRAQPEPLTPEPISLFGRPENVHPSFEAFSQRFLRNFDGSYVPKAERPESLTLEIVLSPDEALLGGVLPVGVPMFSVCPACNGSGQDWLFLCLECGARGYFERQETLDIHIPPMVRAGTIIEAPLRGFGVHNFYLRVRVSISGELAA